MSTLNPCIDPFEDECPKVVRVMTPGPPGPYGGENIEAEDCTITLDTWFAGDWKTAYRRYRSGTGEHAGHPQFGAFWKSEVDGSGGVSGGANLDGAGWFELVKRNALNFGVGNKGPLSNLFVVTLSNEWGDTAGIIANISKLFADVQPDFGTGSGLAWESTTRGYMQDGVTINRDVHVILGWVQPDIVPSFAQDSFAGVAAETFTGIGFAAFVAGGHSDMVGNPQWTWDIAGSQNRQAVNMHWGVTGPAHPDGKGLARFSPGTVGRPGVAFIGDEGTGLFQPAATNHTIGFGTNQIERGRFDSIGNLVLGTGAVATNATAGWLHLVTAPGQPTGVPTVNYAGRAPIVIDTANRAVSYYDVAGAAWHSSPMLDSLLGFNMLMTAEAGQLISGAFVDNRKAAHRFESQSDLTANYSRATVAFMRTAVGSGLDDPVHVDYPAHFEATKKNYLTSTVHGEIDGPITVVRQGKYGDGTGLQVNIQKVAGGTGGFIGFEGQVTKIDSLGTRLSELKTSTGAIFDPVFDIASDTPIAYYTEPRIGASFAALFACGRADLTGDPQFQYIVHASRSRIAGSEFFGITGSAHPDGRGLVRAYDGSPAHPSLSFWNLPDGGLWHSSGNTFSAGIGGTVVTRWAPNTFIVGTQLAGWDPPTATGQVGLALEDGGTITASVDGGAIGFWQRLTSDGQIHQFFRDAAQVGNISVTATATAYNTSSDRRAKTHVETLRDVDEIFDALRAVRFDWIETGEPAVGFIAQEVDEIIPGAASQDEEGNWFLDRSFAVPYLWAQIQNLTGEARELHRRLDEYERREP